MTKPKPAKWTSPADAAGIKGGGYWCCKCRAFDPGGGASPPITGLWYCRFCYPRKDK